MNPSSNALGPTDAIPRAKGSPLPVVLRVQSSKHPATITLTHGKLVIGSGAEADLVLQDSTVSRRHAEVELVPEGMRVSDLGSRNGTYYLGNKVQQMVVVSGGSLIVGRTELRVELDTAQLQTTHTGAGSQQPQRYAELLGDSAALKKLTTSLRRLEGSLVAVLLTGESGTGKELIARALHQNSHVASGPFVALNCGALSATLAQGELFGHRKGAFTGAHESRAGAFEAANGGTLFLDEVGELPLELQPLLLRALQERCITRLGENEPRAVNVRLIAATHRDLAQDVSRGRFREDLYYRLKVVQLQVPALRERPEDIPLLADHFAQLQGASLPQTVMQALAAHSWPGNVRELRHAVDAYLALGELPLLGPGSIEGLEARLAQHLDLNQPYEELKRQFLEHFQRTYVRCVLAQTGGNISQAARVSGLERSYLNKLAQRYSST